MNDLLVLVLLSKLPCPVRLRFLKLYLNYHTANDLAQKSQDWVNKTRLGESERSQEDTLKKDSAELDAKLPSDDVSKSPKDESKEK